MCDLMQHECIKCKVDYTCKDPNWLCPTVNDDEDRNMCPKCIDEFAEEYQKWYDEGGSGAE